MIVLIVILVVLYFAYKFFFPIPKWTGFYYPVAGDLQTYIKSPNEFISIDQCRTWIHQQASIHNSSDLEYDYECGSDCKLSSSGADIYYCKDTVE